MHGTNDSTKSYEFLLPQYIQVTIMEMTFAYAVAFNQVRYTFHILSHTFWIYSTYNHFLCCNTFVLPGIFYTSQFESTSFHPFPLLQYFISCFLYSNQPLNTWDVSSVTQATAMFDRASLFNQPLSNWQTSKITSMVEMFDEASAFNQGMSICVLVCFYSQHSNAVGMTLESIEMDRIWCTLFLFYWALPPNTVACIYYFLLTYPSNGSFHFGLSVSLITPSSLIQILSRARFLSLFHSHSPPLCRFERLGRDQRHGRLVHVSQRNFVCSTSVLGHQTPAGRTHCGHVHWGQRQCWPRRRRRC